MSKAGAYTQYVGATSDGQLFPVVYWCPLPESCLGNNECIKGHTGLHCRECEPFHFQQRGGSVKKRKRTPSGVSSDVSASLCQPCGADSWTGVSAILTASSC